MQCAPSELNSTHCNSKLRTHTVKKAVIHVLESVADYIGTIIGLMPCPSTGPKLFFPKSLVQSKTTWMGFMAISVTDFQIRGYKIIKSFA